MLHPNHVESLVQVFKVRTSKVKEWCEENCIRMDKQKGNETNIDPLLSLLPRRDRERYGKAAERNRKETEIRKVTGWKPSRGTSAFDRGYEAGRDGVRRDKKLALRRRWD